MRSIADFSGRRVRSACVAQAGVEVISHRVEWCSLRAARNLSIKAGILALEAAARGGEARQASAAATEADLRTTAQAVWDALGGGAAIHLPTGLDAHWPAAAPGRPRVPAAPAAAAEEDDSQLAAAFERELRQRVGDLRLLEELKCQVRLVCTSTRHTDTFALVCGEGRTPFGDRADIRRD